MDRGESLGWRCEMAHVSIIQLVQKAQPIFVRSNFFWTWKGQTWKMVSRLWTRRKITWVPSLNWRSLCNYLISNFHGKLEKLCFLDRKRMKPDAFAVLRKYGFHLDASRSKQIRYSHHESNKRSCSIVHAVLRIVVLYTFSFLERIHGNSVFVVPQQWTARRIWTLTLKFKS